MTTTLRTPLSFEEFLRADTPDDRHYELVAGQLVPMADPIGKHEVVARFLLLQFIFASQQSNLGYEVFPSILVKIAGGSGHARRPDVVVMTRAQYAEVADTEIAARQPPPLVVDVVSTNWRDDYVTKLSEYERTGIPEYWIVDYAALAARAYTGDPKQPVVSVGTLTEGRYTVERYRGEMAIASPTFPNLTLTVNQIVASTEI